MMRALVLGSGGREHALAWALRRSPSIGEVVVDAAPADDVVALAEQHQVDLVVVGPEAPLCAGAVDALSEAGIAAFGPAPPPHGSRAVKPS